MNRRTLLLDHARLAQRVTWASLAGLVLIPLAIAGLLMLSLWQPQERLETVTAAIVNNDEPIEIDGQLTPLGRALAGGLIGEHDDNFTWVLTDTEGAEAGLRSGEFVAALTIPETFSADVMSFSTDPDEARRAEVTLTGGEQAKLVDGAIAQTIAQTAVNLFNEQISATTIGQLIGGVGTIGEQLGGAADGATQLADGTSQFVGGVSSLAEGLTQLATSTSALPGQVGQLSTGAAGMAGGTQQFAVGLDQLAQLAAGVDAACGADPAGAACAGARGQLTAAVSGLPGQFAPINSGAAQLSTGAGQLAAGMTPLTEAIATASTGATTLAGSGPGLVTGAQQLADGLGDAVAQLPSADDDEAATVSELAARPVALAIDGPLFGNSAGPLAAGLALWLGALATFLVLRATPRETLGTAASPVRQALTAAWPALAIGAAQATTVAIALQPGLQLEPLAWFGLLAVCLAVSAVFMAVNQALVAVAGGAGRFISVLVAVLFVATGLISTAPAALASLTDVLPVQPAYSQLAAATGGAPTPDALVQLAVWLLLAFAATAASIALRRTASAREIAAGAIRR